MSALEASKDDILRNAPPSPSANRPQSFLILQGPPSRFSIDLGNELSAQGFAVRRVNLCVGDWFYWHDHRSVNFRGRLSEWPEFLRNLILTEGITDIIYYADRLPYHRVAARVADQCAIRAMSYEFGYLRPDWITLERRGQTIYSHFPNDLAQIKALAKGLKRPDMKHKYSFSFFTEAKNEVFYQLSNYFLWYLFPHYKRDRYYNPILDYLSYIPRLMVRRRNAEPAERFVEKIVAAKQPYFVVPLQMQGDYQIRSNSQYGHCSEFIDEILHSFAQHAGQNVQLVFKVHPGDNGWERWGRVIGKRAESLGLEGRVHYLDGGNLQNLLASSKGVLTINSTTGVHALQALVPVKVLGVSVYDIPGLTFQGSLDAFWKNTQKPRRPAVRALVTLMAASIHVKGDFFSEPGRKAAVRAFVRRLTTGHINAYGGFVDPPPRLERAQAMGIEVDLPDKPRCFEGEPAKNQADE